LVDIKKNIEETSKEMATALSAGDNDTAAIQDENMMYALGDILDMSAKVADNFKSKLNPQVEEFYDILKEHGGLDEIFGSAGSINSVIDDIINGKKTA